MFFADLEQNQITAQDTIPGAAQLLRHLAAQGESIPIPDGSTPAATVSHSALAQHFAQDIAPTSPDADFAAALEICLRRDVIEAIADAGDEPQYKFQVELIRRWFSQ